MEEPIRETKTDKRSYKKDVLLIAGLVVIGLIIGAVLLLSRHDGMEVQVRVSGAVIKTFPLSENTEYEIRGADGGSNYLIIRDGAAWVEEADCPDKLCRNMGKIHLAGQSIVCLPHEVAVEITGGTGAETQEADIIAE